MTKEAQLKKLRSELKLQEGIRNKYREGIFAVRAGIKISSLRRQIREIEESK